MGGKNSKFKLKKKPPQEKKVETTTDFAPVIPNVYTTETTLATFKQDQPATDLYKGQNTVLEESGSGAVSNVLVGLFDFESRSEKELGFSQGERLILIKSEDEEWLQAKHESTGKVGYIPANFVAKAESLELYFWYFGKINRRESESLLLQHPDGTFLVRDSFSNPGDYALSLKFDDQSRKSPIRHYVIKFNNFQYSIWGKKKFSALNDLIEEYATENHGLPTVLTQPCPKIRPSMNELSVETKDEWEIPRHTIKLFKEIGSGNFGTVHSGMWNNKIEVAVKTLKIGKMPKEEFLAEATIMKGLKHENILSLLATCSQEEPIYIITQFMQNGSLINYLRKNKEHESLSYDQMLEFAFQIAKGMAYLEIHNLIHRDLAARNVLVDDRLTCKIADFGLAKILVGTAGHSYSSGKFPVKWSPPEVLLEGKFSIKSDVWSFGIVMIEIFTYGDPLYPGFNQKEVRVEVVNGLRPSQPPLCPTHIYELLLKCWDHNPNGRPNFSDLKAYLDDSSHKVNDGTQYIQT